MAVFNRLSRRPSDKPSLSPPSRRHPVAPPRAPPQPALPPGPPARPPAARTPPVVRETARRNAGECTSAPEAPRLVSRLHPCAPLAPVRPDHGSPGDRPSRKVARAKFSRRMVATRSVSAAREAAQPPAITGKRSSAAQKAWSSPGCCPSGGGGGGGGSAAAAGCCGPVPSIGVLADCDANKASVALAFFAAKSIVLVHLSTFAVMSTAAPASSSAFSLPRRCSTLVHLLQKPVAARQFVPCL